MDSPRAVLLIVLLLFLFLSPDIQQPTPDHRRELTHAIDQERHALGVLSASRHDDLNISNHRWLNLTGFRAQDGYAWDTLQPVKDAALQQLSHLVGERGMQRLAGGLRPPDHNQSDGSLQNKQPPSLNLQEPIPLYHNVTGLVRGRWARSALEGDRPAPHVNLTALVPEAGFASLEYKRNITGSTGDVQVKLDEKTGNILVGEDGIARQLGATMTIKDETSLGDGWDVNLHGVHYPEMGQIVLTSTSEKYAGIFALPHFALSDHTYSLAQSLLTKALSETIKRQESPLYTGPSNPWSASSGSLSDMSPPTPHCEYVVYLQQHPVELSNSRPAKSPTNPVLLDLLEDDLRFPTGAPLPKAPQMTMSMVIFSPDCGFILESKGPPRFAPQDGNHLRGPKVESYMRIAKNYSLFFGLICSAQLVLLVRQMTRASTPSTVSRVSLYTIGMLAMGDGFASVTFLTVGMFVDAAFLTLISTAFLAFICVSFFGMKFLMDIWTVQAPERAERERHNASNNNDAAASPARSQTTVPAVAVAPVDTETLPSPATALPTNNSSATPVILPPDQDTTATEADPTTAAGANTTTGTARREMGALYSRFYLILLAIIFLSLHATSWATPLRSAYTNVLSLTYFSFWVPQIHRNIMRNTRKALAWEFVLGQSILRLLPFIYLFTVTDNILFVHTDRFAALVLVGWVWIQILLLASQDLAGPRCFTPKGWAPPAYDYHPILREDDIESGVMMALGAAQTGVEDKKVGETSQPDGATASKSSRTFDCAICTEHIEVPIVPPGSGASDSAAAGLAGGILRRYYMVTPCHHIYHSECLEGWLRYRLQCPVCRSPCPPI